MGEPGQDREYELPGYGSGVRRTVDKDEPVEQLEQNSRDTTAGTRQLVYDSWDRTAGTGQLGQDS
jgi:hypothetical protein